jgi:hypothetical protein
MKFTVCVFLFLLACSCSKRNHPYIEYSSDGIKVENVNLKHLGDTKREKCFTFKDIADIKNVFEKYNGEPAKSYEFSVFKRDTGTCVGVYSFINNKGRSFYSFYKVLKFEDKVIMNFKHRVSEPVDLISIKQFNEFEERYSHLFSSNDIDEMRNYYLRGVESQGNIYRR